MRELIRILLKDSEGCIMKKILTGYWSSKRLEEVDFSICFLIEEILYHMIFSKGLEEEQYSMCFLVEEILIAIKYLTRRITLGKVFECVGCSLKYFEKTYYHMWSFQRRFLRRR
jgi:hypothetical protein